ncbi:MAG: hypothetical protein JSV78_10770 [Phycisphaerales bacterium]|nr:MAG: hypothetical protein JSV78_10770 [Phycisphaerales bacterium]
MTRLTDRECGFIDEENMMSVVKDEANDTAEQVVGSSAAGIADEALSGAEQVGTTVRGKTLNVAASIDEALAAAAEGLRNVANGGIQPTEAPKQKAAQTSEDQAPNVPEDQARGARVAVDEPVLIESQRGDGGLTPQPEPCAESEEETSTTVLEGYIPLAEVISQDDLNLIRVIKAEGVFAETSGPSTLWADSQGTEQAVAQIESGVRKLAAILHMEVNERWRQAGERLEELERCRTEVEEARAKAQSIIEELYRLKEECAITLDAAAKGCRETGFLHKDARKTGEHARADMQAAQVAASQSRWEAGSLQKPKG